MVSAGHFNAELSLRLPGARSVQKLYAISLSPGGVLTSFLRAE
jgi:hypothetical protein